MAHLLRRGTPLDLDKISWFLLERAQARDVPVSKTAFRDPELAKRSRYGYDDLRVTIQRLYMPIIPPTCTAASRAERQTENEVPIK